MEHEHCWGSFQSSASARQKDNQVGSPLQDVEPVSSLVTDPHLRHPGPNDLDITRIAADGALGTRLDLGRTSDQPDLEAVEPSGLSNTHEPSSKHNSLRTIAWTESK